MTLPQKTLFLLVLLSFPVFSYLKTEREYISEIFRTNVPITLADGRTMKVNAVFGHNIFYEFERPGNFKYALTRLVQVCTVQPRCSVWLIGLIENEADCVKARNGVEALIESGKYQLVLHYTTWPIYCDFFTVAPIGKLLQPAVPVG